MSLLPKKALGEQKINSGSESKNLNLANKKNKKNNVRTRQNCERQPIRLGLISRIYYGGQQVMGFHRNGKLLLCYIYKKNAHMVRIIMLCDIPQKVISTKHVPMRIAYTYNNYYHTNIGYYILLQKQKLLL